jgi:hypothetical protein
LNIIQNKELNQNELNLELKKKDSMETKNMTNDEKTP